MHQYEIHHTSWTPGKRTSPACRWLLITSDNISENSSVPLAQVVSSISDVPQ